MDNWFNEKIFVNGKMILYEKTRCAKTISFDYVPIENYIFLLYTEIGVGNQKKYSYFEWINERIELISENKVNMTNCLLNLEIELNSYQKKYDEWINNNRSSLAEFRLERQSIQCFMKGKDDNNKFVVAKN